MGNTNDERNSGWMELERTGNENNERLTGRRDEKRNRLPEMESVQPSFITI